MNAGMSTSTGQPAMQVRLVAHAGSARLRARVLAGSRAPPPRSSSRARRATAPGSACAPEGSSCGSVILRCADAACSARLGASDRSAGWPCRRARLTRPSPSFSSWRNRAADAKSDRRSPPCGRRSPARPRRRTSILPPTVTRQPPHMPGAVDHDRVQAHHRLDPVRPGASRRRPSSSTGGPMASTSSMSGCFARAQLQRRRSRGPSGP